jgi:zinc D-Ala-D-Ala carboxypeptidase
VYVRTRDDGLGQAPAVGNGWKQIPQLGPGRYSGEIRRGPDGRVYRWTAGVDGLGNAGGFWTALSDRAKKAWGRLVEKIREVMAGGILNNANITLATGHVSKKIDNANARQNIVDSSKGINASRSSYNTAPGGTVKLDIRMLVSILKLAETFRFAISELAGGEHAPGSRHYKGVSVDVNIINGRHVGKTHPDVANFMQQCRDLGATEVKGPGDPGHPTHVHCAWPVP